MAIEDDIYYLVRHPTLATLEHEALRRLVSAATPRMLRAGEVLFRRDEPSDGGYFLRSGSIALDPINDVPTRILEPPALIGEMALIAPTRRPATAVAYEASAILEIPRTLFQRTLSESPRSAERLHRLIAERLRNFTQGLDGVRKNILEADES